jgi:hypothetical protein
VDGVCKVCDGDPNKKCCSDGSCVKPCELEENKAMCTGETLLCPHWCDVSCDDYYKINWTGNAIYSCKEPGCPGDCQDEEKPVCYTKTLCSQQIIVKQMCVLGYCLAAPTEGFTCTICVHGQHPVENYYAPYNKKCGQ